MDKENKFEFGANWYELWMKQSKEFYDSAQKNFQQLFMKNAHMNPEDNMKLINDWVENLKRQWQTTQLNDQQKMYENYWKMMYKMCSDASDKLIQEWIARTKENNPIKNTQELYELWLNCCNDVYKKSLQSHSFQDAYGEMMNTAMQFWKSALHK